MTDRVPLYPGRVKLVPVSGQSNTYDMSRADQPTQEGTPLNKATFLKDSTATAFGLSTDAVPDDVLKLLSRFQKGLGNEYLWIRGVYETADGDNLYGAKLMDPNVSGDMLLISDSVSISANGDVSLVEPTQQQVSAAFRSEVVDNPSILRGKYIQLQNGLEQYANTICRVTSTATFYASGRYLYCYDNSVYRVVTIISLIDYVNSANQAAYPPSEPDGYAYSPLGQLGDKVRIETGSYVGTGTYGSRNPNSLTFEFEPIFLLVGDNGNSWNSYIDGMGYGFYASSNYSNRFTKSATTVSWYNTSSDIYQLNSSGTTYYYIAIG